MRALRIAALLTAAALAAFYLPAKDRRPLLSLSGVRARASGLAETVRPGERKDESVRTLYKWREADGSWAYSDRRPAGRPDAQEVRVPVSWVQDAGEGGGAAEGGDAAPGSAAELLERSRALEGKVQSREAQLEEIVREQQP